MSILGIRAILAITLVLAGLGGVAYIRGVIKDNAELRSTQTAIMKRMQNAEENLAKLDNLSAERTAGQGNIRAEVSGIQGRIQTEVARDETSRNYLDTPIPDGVRFSVLGQAASDPPAGAEGTGRADEN